ncbi:MAG: hypothetical protein DWH78_09765 [Planctomycetota bacterium]|nr:MAG: hypothetical protein DWH78_09765 [Planctomycetota bacterium]
MRAGDTFAPDPETVFLSATKISSNAFYDQKKLTCRNDIRPTTPCHLSLIARSVEFMDLLTTKAALV